VTVGDDQAKAANAGPGLRKPTPQPVPGTQPHKPARRGTHPVPFAHGGITQNSSRGGQRDPNCQYQDK